MNEELTLEAIKKIISEAEGAGAGAEEIMGEILQVIPTKSSMKLLLLSLLLKS